ncbi:FAD-binding oxidoreductase [Cohaesibacter haloalkalitolerans]|uniref:FAD-binding oxidoreductase n=1 Tax=Cohaesibacter haloalkalitolerans TaxID=1162980 RepID=UPI000E64CB90|nr:FAD-binding oxidoreductase [Cohaesibacter haloalkalitolerans]
MQTIVDATAGKELPGFLDRVTSLFTELQVTSGSDIGEAWKNATFPWSGRPLAILKPKTADIVAPLLSLASEWGMPVHPVSRGRNWGLGSRLPLSDALILDLSSLDRILDLDMENGMVRIEPGVTFKSLQQRLKKEGLSYHLPAFGGPVDASVLANALERGEGIGAYGDRFGLLWDFDVALATGERLRTGHARIGLTEISRLHARPAGPLIEGLFSQSNFGIVLSATIALQPTLPYACAIMAEIKENDGLERAVPVLRRLITSGLIAPQSLVLWDSAKQASSLLGRYAKEAESLLAKPKQWGASLLAFAPHPDLMRLTQEIIHAELVLVSNCVHIQDDRDEVGHRQETIMTGFSDGNNAMSGYWGKKHRPQTPGNMDTDRCGFVWLCPVIPFEAKDICNLEKILTEESQSENLFAALGMQAISSRALHCFVSLAWDRDDPLAEADALSAHANISKRLKAEGYSPYRLGLLDLELATKPTETWTSVRRRLKNALDPQGILSPGRMGD